MAKPCIVTYKGKKYSYEEFASELHDGLLDKLISEGDVLLGAAEDQAQYKKINNRDFDYFREKFLKRDIEEEQANIELIKSVMKDPEISKEDKQEIEGLLEAIREQKAEDKIAYEEYLEEKKKIEKIQKAEDLENYSFDELVKDYYIAKQSGEDLKEASLRLADYLNTEATQRLAKIDKNIETKANQKDFTPIQRWMKVLSNVSEGFPALQGLSREFEKRYLAKVQESNNLKEQHEKLGKSVIKEKNKGLGKISDLFSSDSAKYFEYLDDGGKLRTNTEGLSKAQKDYLKFIQDLVKDRNTIIDEDGNILDNTLIKVDKGFQETFKSEGYKAALLSLIPKPAETKINYNGALTSKFDRPYKGKSYSKDFYKAANMFIEDLTHVKYMKDLVPVVDGLEMFYKKLGFEEGKSFENTIKFIQDWKRAKVYHEKGVVQPGIDIPLRVLRQMTSMAVMAFNVPANLMNVAIGNYNAIRESGVWDWSKGQKRMFLTGERELKKDNGYGIVSKKAMDVLRMYDVVNPDYDSNPKHHALKLFDALAYAGLRWGEIQIQGSQFLGKLDDKEYDKLVYDKSGKLVLDPSMTKEEKEKFNEKMIKYKNEVTDVQGKYSEKDRANFMNYELGKSAAQFKLWLPAWWKARFGPEFINSNNEIKRGSWNFTQKAIDEIRNDFSEKGILKGAWENKQIMTNLKSAMAVATLLVLVLQDDDDEDKRKSSLSLESALSNMFGIFDPQQTKYLLTSPIASLGVVTKFIDALDAALHGDSKKAKNSLKKIVPYNKLTKIPEDIKAMKK